MCTDNLVPIIYDTGKFQFVKVGISHTKYPSRTRIPLSRTRLLPSRTRLPPSRTRFQSRSRWAFCCKWSKIDWMSMNEEKARTGIRVREVEKSHSTRIFSKGRGAKKKGPNCIQIRVLLWCRKQGSAPAAKKAPLGLFLNAASTPVHHR